MDIKEIIEGLRCEECSEKRVFGNIPNSSAENLYVYIDMTGATRCFCKKHMSYCKENCNALLQYNDEHDGACYGAKLISELIKEK